MPSLNPLKEANQRRHQISAEYAVEASRKALATGALPKPLAHAARLRADNPNMTLSQLADQAGLSMNTYVSRLRRAIRLGRAARPAGRSARGSTGRRIDWGHLATRVMGSFVTIPTPTSLRAVEQPGMRIIAATEIVKALRALENLFRGVIDDSAIELYHQARAAAPHGTPARDLWHVIAPRSEFLDTTALAERVAVEQRQSRYREAA